ncbi:MAG: restriction endonuclease subunit S [Nostocales cyanobacterium ELA583]|jgi:type I restriction enzyme S subunit
MSWYELQLGEVISIKHGWAFKGEFFADEGEFVLLTPGNFFENGGIKLKGEKEKYYTDNFPEEFLLSEGDILVVMTDLKQTAPILGASLIIPQDKKFLHNQRLGLVQIKEPTKIDYKFLYYIFNSPTYRSQIRASATGATVRHTAPERIYKCKILCPRDINNQKCIAEILSNYDNLIDNNNRQIALLEESIHLLYKYWFVRLRFPGYESVKVVDGVPKGWKYESLETTCELIMGQSPPSEFYNNSGQGLPFHQGVSNFGNRFVNHEIYCTQINRIAEPGDILCSVRAPVGRLNITIDKIIIGRGLSAIRNRLGNQSFQYYQLKTLFFQEDIIGNGSIFASVTKKQLSQQLIIVPSAEIINKFEKISKPVDKQIINLYFQNQKLKEARDFLLPRLMSGKIIV